MRCEDCDDHVSAVSSPMLAIEGVWESARPKYCSEQDVNFLLLSSCLEKLRAGVRFGSVEKSLLLAIQNRGTGRTASH